MFPTSIDHFSCHSFSYRSFIAYDGLVDVTVLLVSWPYVTYRDDDGTMCFYHDIAYWTAVMFLGGVREIAMGVSRNGSIKSEVMMSGDGSLMPCGGHPRSDPIDLRIPLCIAGKAASSPADITALLRGETSRRVFVCPIDQELAALGGLLCGLRARGRQPGARRITISAGPVDRTNLKKMSDFDPKLEGDPAINMAYLMSRSSMAVVNRIDKVLGVSPFYGRLLVRPRCGQHDGRAVWLVRADEVGKFFPHEKPSLRNYAASCVPARMQNTDRFSEASGSEEADVDVFVVTNYLPEAVVFMNAFHAMSGHGVVMSLPEPDKIVGTIPCVCRDGIYAAQ